MTKKRFHFPTCQITFKDGKPTKDIDDIYTNTFKCKQGKKRTQKKRATVDMTSPLNLHTLDDLKNLVAEVREKYAKQFEE